MGKVTPAWKPDAPVVVLPGGGAPLDLRQALRLKNTTSSSGAIVDRTPTDTNVDVVDDSYAKVDAQPLHVDAYIDGIQASTTLTYLHGRPVRLVHTAAGAANNTPDLVGVVEDISVLASEVDQEWLEENLPQDFPRTLVAADTPPEVEAAISDALSGMRDSAENTLTAEILNSGARRVCVDGDLLGRPHTPAVFGVVKSVRTKYLPDESGLWSLRQGWRSPVFRISGKGPERYSCYVRLHSAAARPWSHGIIRVETSQADLIDAAAARALAERQPATSNDPRWDRHLTPIRATEQLLRSRRPAVF